MGNLLDYLDWRGDLSLEAVPLCDVDLAVLARAAYLPFNGVVSESMDSSLPFPQVMRQLESSPVLPICAEQDALLIRKLAGSRRFSDCRLCGFWQIADSQTQEQFAAISLLLPDGSAVAVFRGTDATLVGWKEDFNMSFSAQVPSQAEAVRYIVRLAQCHPVPLRLCGHSKGGNLAMYAAVFSPEFIRRRVISACNFDGPGFDESAARSAACQTMADRMHTYLPRSSVVGMMLAHAEDYTVVESKSVSLMQHDIYRWQILGGDFVTVESRANSSYFMDDTLKRWVAELEPETREATINAIYQLISAPGGEQIGDLADMRSILRMLRAAGSLNAPQRRAILEAGRKLRVSLKAALPAYLQKVRIGKKDSNSQESETD